MRLPAGSLSSFEKCGDRCPFVVRISERSSRPLVWGRSRGFTLLGTIQHLEAVGVDLYLDQQSIDTTTPAGKLLFQMTGAFAEFERSMIRQRVRAGLSVVKAKIERDGKFVSKAGKVRKRLGRPGAEADKLDRARQELAKGTGIIKTAKLTGLGTGTVHKLRREMGTL